MLTRLVCAMRDAGHESSVILKVVEKASREALLDVSSLRDVCLWDESRRPRFCSMYDLDHNMSAAHHSFLERACVAFGGG